MFDTLTRMGASNPSGYKIERSLRFNAIDSANLTRTSSGTSTTFTYSAWIKRSCNPSDYEYIFSMGNRGFSFHKDNDTFYLYDGSDLNESTAKFRDPSAWYHVVVQINSGVATSYINNVQVHNAVGSGFTLTTGSNETRIGSHASSNFYYNGYMTEIHLVDGSVVAPSSFAETSAATGQWIPKEYEGSHGTHGFYLKFDDNSNTTSGTLGKDSAGSNDFTPNNFSVAAGVHNDSLIDTPTNNFATGNPLAMAGGANVVSYKQGNLYVTINGSGQMGMSTIQIPTSGKWYAEMTYTDIQYGRAGITNYEKLRAGTNNGTEKWNGIEYTYDGKIKIDDADSQTSLTTLGDNDILGIAVDRDAETVQFSINGTNKGSAANINSLNDKNELVFTARRHQSGGSAPAVHMNFGQRPFGNLPAGFKSLCIDNLSTPTIKDGSDYFNTVLYTGNGTTDQAKTVGFQPSLVWIKKRNNADDHIVSNSVTGTPNYLKINSSAAEASYAEGVKSLDANGFTIGNANNTNQNGHTFASWSWKESAPAGFDIVSYTGNGSARTISHSLGVQPDFMLAKNRDQADGWQVFHKSKGSGFTQQFDGPGVFENIDAIWNNTGPTSSVFSVGDDHKTNANGEDYIIFLWSSIEGYSKISDYRGNGDANGQFIYTGFKPAFVLIKCSSDAEAWNIFDNKRDPDNKVHHLLVPNTNTEENNSTAARELDFCANGFKMRGTNDTINGSGKIYVYLAIAEVPFQYSNAR